MFHKGIWVSFLNSIILQRKQHHTVSQDLYLEFFTTSYNYFVQIVPVAVVAPQYFSGAIQLGVVSQSAGAFNHILRDLSVIVNQFENLSTFSAAIDRLSSFMKAIRDVDEDRTIEDGLLQLPQNNVTDTEQLCEDSFEKGEAMTTSKINLNQMKPVNVDDSSSFSHPILSIENLNLSTPDGKRDLIQQLSISIKDGE